MHIPVANTARLTGASLSKLTKRAIQLPEGKSSSRYKGVIRRHISLPNSSQNIITRHSRLTLHVQHETFNSFITNSCKARDFQHATFRSKNHVKRVAFNILQSARLSTLCKARGFQHSAKREAFNTLQSARLSALTFEFKNPVKREAFNFH
jgi:hypothetical protein